MVAIFFVITIPGYAQEGKVQLVWQDAEDAVVYELEVLTTRLDRDTVATDEQVVYRRTSISTPGIELELSLFEGQKLSSLYYRTRPLDLDLNPIASFSSSISMGKATMNPKKPTITAFLKKNHPAPLYPVYSWIPVLGASGYEVEITSRQPENPNSIAPSRYRIRSLVAGGGFDYYDFNAYAKPGTYYWRVRGLGAGNVPIGSYSYAVPFTVKTDKCKWAVFGDSITHGGGAVSNPPSDVRFEYVSYLPFAVQNLGRSGDTVEMMVDRFDSDVLPFKPKYLLVLGGSNSIRGGVTGESVIESLETIKSKCIQNGITPIFLTLPPLNPERIERVFHQPTAENWQEELAKVNEYIRLQIYNVDIYPLLADENGILPVAYAEDGLHPDISGKKIMGEAIKEYLKNNKFP